MNEGVITAETAEITFSAGTFAGYWLTGILYMVLPIAAFFTIGRYSKAKYLPLIAGILAYFISTKLCDLTVWLLLFSAPYAVKVAIATEIVCFFEEPARWLAMKYPVSNIITPAAAVCYGIGHAGIECWMRGISTFRIICYGQDLERYGIEHFTDGKTAENAETVINKLQKYADTGLFMGVLNTLDLIVAFGFHIALSMLIFRKMKEQNFLKRWLPLAVLLHYVMNALPGLVSFSGNMYLTSITSIITGLGIIALVYRLAEGRECIDGILFPDITE
ncbi:YhfC family glutamic-type intramembrane protease [Ruminococcus flavefaciens]|uniref:YhfC family glutamic-type intramembrane protease n=1 Tax=Ruminococcus flavefaciens TaxID=1265 RepID=UPI0003803CC4|nr:YhfC family glutamic-type intramembrane protease [Ruminococcus flavefaciens]